MMVVVFFAAVCALFGLWLLLREHKPRKRKTTQNPPSPLGEEQEKREQEVRTQGG